MTLRLAHNVLKVPVAAPLRRKRCGSSEELDLTRGERFLLAVGVHIACATIAIVDRPTVSRGDRPN